MWMTQTHEAADSIIADPATLYATNAAWTLTACVCQRIHAAAQ